MNGLLCHVETFEATCTPANIMRNFDIHTRRERKRATGTQKKRAIGTQALNKKISEEKKNRERPSGQRSSFKKSTKHIECGNKI